MNDTCSVTTSYYGGVPTCSIADDKDPAPWESESCGVCDALRSSFGDLPYGTSSSGGAYVNLSNFLSRLLNKPCMVLQLRAWPIHLPKSGPGTSRHGFR